MKYILYYSNFCNHCKILLMELAKSKIKNEINFLCIDRRIKQNGKVMIILENGSQLPLPSNVVEVPSLLMLKTLEPCGPSTRKMFFDLTS